MGVTRDGVIVVSHDRRLNPDLARTADGAYVAPPGTPFVRLPLAEIKKYDVGQIRPGSVYAAQFPDQRAVPGTPIPTLAEVFGLVRKSGGRHVRLNIETKIDPNHPDESPDPEHFVALVLGLLEAENFSDRVMISVFRLAHVADRPEIGAQDTDRIFEPAGGTCADGLSRQAVAMDGGVQPGRAWKVAAAHDKGRRRRDLVAILWRCRPGRHRRIPSSRTAGRGVDGRQTRRHGANDRYRSGWNYLRPSRSVAPSCRREGHHFAASFAGIALNHIYIRHEGRPVRTSRRLRHASDPSPMTER